ncbi:MAG: GyrI-like domain-containing protein [bacterium]|nr:GyrI-like domain-containing protein [bacterium]
MPNSGYVPKNIPSFHIYYNNPKEDPDLKMYFDLCIPIEPLRIGKK